MSDFFGIIGYVLVCGFYPVQLWHTFRTKQVAGWNPRALWTMAAGLAALQISMTFYGRYPLYIAGNGFGLLCSLTMLAAYYRYRKEGNGG